MADHDVEHQRTRQDDPEARGGGLVGSTNRWDQPLGATALPLLDAEGLRSIGAGAVEIGSHSRSHADLTKLGDEGALVDEVAGSRDDLEAMGLPRPRLLAYPYGERDDRVVRAVAAAGFEAAFALADRAASPGSNRFEVPRFEVHRGETGAALVRRLFPVG